MRLSDRIKQSSFQSAAQEAAINLFVATDHLRQKGQSLCESFGITTAQYNVLRILKGVYPNGHARCAIAERMIERAPDVTRLLDRLVSQALARRFPSTDDARKSVATITQKGLNLLEKMKPAIDALDNQLTERLTNEELVTLSRICEKIYSEDEGMKK
jgi:DNA-binding MarR family transcriptional regulator